MKINTTQRYWRIVLRMSILLWICATAACSWLDSNSAQEHPWIAQPIRRETQEYFCTKLGLSSNDPVCQSNQDVFVADLLPIVQQRFPINQTPYAEVAEALKGYPVQPEETKSPDGTVTSKRYVYLLTEFDGFCVYFSIRDVQSGVVTDIYSSSIGSGPTRDTCTSTEVREQLRSWLKSK